MMQMAQMAAQQQGLVPEGEPAEGPMQ